MVELESVFEFRVEVRGDFRWMIGRKLFKGGT